jgi:hypothetical protein
VVPDAINGPNRKLAWRVEAVEHPLRVHGQFRSKLVPLATAGCPGRSVLSMDALHAGTGIPGYQIR